MVIIYNKCKMFLIHQMFWIEQITCYVHERSDKMHLASEHFMYIFFLQERWVDVWITNVIPGC